MKASNSDHQENRPVPPPLAGNVDGFAAGKLWGWINVDDDDTSVELSLRVDDEVVVVATADRPRPDAAALAGARPACGFAFDLTKIQSPSNLTISVVHDASGYDFHGARWSYCDSAAASVTQNIKSLESLFFAEYYRYRYGLENYSNEQSFQHYVKNGIFRGDDPCPWFSNKFFLDKHSALIDSSELPVLTYIRNQHRLEIQPSALFSPEYYARSNPQLDTNRLLAHHVQHGNAEGRHTIERRITEPVLQELQEMTLIEPSIAMIRTGPRSIVRHGLPTATNYFPKLIQRRFEGTIDVIICVPFLPTSDADQIGLHLLRVYQQTFGLERVLLIVTEPSEATLPLWLDQNTRILYLEVESKFTDHAEKVRTLHDVVGLLAPSRMVNVNSLTAWNMYRRFGRQMTTAMELNAYVFRFDQAVEGQQAGYISDYVPDLIGVLANVYCDNQTVIEQMRKLYGFSREDMNKFSVLYMPAPENLPRRRIGLDEVSTYNRGLPILWIGHLSDHKRPDLLVSIATAMPNQQFIVYGPAGDSPYSHQIIDGEFPNISYRGVYSSIQEINGDDYSLFLNTSTWEGLPHTIIQMVGIGVPVVTSLTGGIAELVDETNGWPVENDESVIEYVAQISSVLIQHERVLHKSRIGLAIFAERHTWQAFCRRTEQLGISVDEQKINLSERVELARSTEGRASILAKEFLQIWHNRKRPVT